MKIIINVLLLLVVGLIIVSCQKEISTSPGNDPIYNGRILIDSDPQGAEIFINGDNTGKLTPDSIIHLEPGQYNIKIRLYPYLDLIDSLDVDDNITKEFSANFFGDPRNFRSITVNSNPTGAVIYLRDSCLNVTTPYTIEQ